MIRAQAGRYVPLHVDTEQEIPDEAPVATVLGPTASVVLSLELPPLVFPHLFGSSVRVELDPGNYAVAYEWEVGGVGRVKIETLRVLPGGDRYGAIDSLGFFDPSHGRFVVARDDGGRHLFKRNPKP